MSVVHHPKRQSAVLASSPSVIYPSPIQSQSAVAQSAGAQEPDVQITRPEVQSNKFAKFTLAALFTLATSGVFLGGSLIVYTVFRSIEHLQIEQSQKASLVIAEQMRNAGHYTACLIESSKIPVQSPYHTDAYKIQEACQDAVVKQQLSEVQQLSQEGKLEDAVQIAGQIAPGTADTEVQEAVNSISARLLDIGRQQYQTISPDYLNHATYSIAAIPQTSIHYETAQSLLKQWDEEYSSSKTYMQTAQTAIEQGNILLAKQSLEQISPHPFWQKQADTIRQEIVFRTSYQTAEAYLQNGEWENAIATVQPLPDVMPWSERKAYVIGQAETAINRQKICKTFTLGLINCDNR